MLGSSKLKEFADDNFRLDEHGRKFLKSQQRPTRKVFVYKIQVNPIHTVLKYCDYYDFVDRKWCSS